MDERRLVMVPGPINFDPRVLRELAVEGLDHTSADFVSSFAETLSMLRKVVNAGNEYQPVVIAGSGTLAMEASVTNFLEKEGRALVVSNGYFGDRFAELLSNYEVHVDVLRPDRIGRSVDASKVVEAASKGKYDLITLTHVDTSTGVLQSAKEIGRELRDEETIIVVDGVCSVGGEEIKMAEDGIDVLFTGSQKALGVPPGLAIMWLSPKALQKLKSIRRSISPYYMNLNRWISIMRSYEEKKPSYFGTPAVNLIVALRKSLELILEEGMEKRYLRHRMLSEAFREGMKALNLQLLADESSAAHTITAVKLPDVIPSSSLVDLVRSIGVLIAKGLIKDINYFRVGHMGTVNANDIVATVAAIERALAKLGYKMRFGDGVAGTQEVLHRYSL
ncbi:MAG: alanine--glyoxylate aminotransferase family protein [Thermoproteota archaeon]|nr:MAG: alanine--glyoxylate aminotransferase family protein [Candidatus Korarchaeota archaeon]